MKSSTTKLKPLVPRLHKDGGLVMASFDPNNLPANANNKNAFAGIKLGVPASPLEALVSMNPSDYTYSMPAAENYAGAYPMPPGAYYAPAPGGGYVMAYTDGAAPPPPGEEGPARGPGGGGDAEHDHMIELLDGVIELDDDSLRSLLGDEEDPQWYGWGGGVCGLVLVHGRQFSQHAPSSFHQQQPSTADGTADAATSVPVAVDTSSPCSDKTSQQPMDVGDIGVKTQQAPTNPAADVMVDGNDDEHADNNPPAINTGAEPMDFEGNTGKPISGYSIDVGQIERDPIDAVDEEPPPQQPVKRVKSEAAMLRHAPVMLSELPFEEAVDVMIEFLKTDRYGSVWEKVIVFVY